MLSVDQSTGTPTTPPRSSYRAPTSGRRSSDTPVEEAGTVAEDRHGDLAERGTELGVDDLHRRADDVERGARGAAPAGDELDRNAAEPHLAGDLRSGAVHHDDLMSLLAQPQDAIRRLRGDGAAHLHDQAGHERYSALMRT